MAPRPHCRDGHGRRQRPCVPPPSPAATPALALVVLYVAAALPAATAQLPVTNGLVFHLDAQASGVVSGTTWSDSSGNGAHATAYNGGGSMPQLVTSSNNGKSFKVMRFDGNDGMCINTNLGRPYTCFIVNRYWGGTQGRTLQSRDTNWLLGLWAGRHGHYALGWVSSSGNTAGTSWYIATGVGRSGSVRADYYSNGNSMTVSTSPQGVPQRLGLVGCGQHGNEQSQAEIAEVLCYNRDLFTDREKVEGYLGERYGIPTPNQLGQSANPGKSCNDLLGRGIEDSGAYWIKPDDAYAAFPVYCDQSSDGGGWSLVISYPQTQTPLRYWGNWPEVTSQSDVFATRMYKGSLEIFSEAREEVNSGAAKVWGRKLSKTKLDKIRRSYMWGERVGQMPQYTDVPNCRTSYSAATDNIAGCSRYSGGNSDTILGWQVDLHASSHCWAGRGSCCGQGPGSGLCAGNPNGQKWSRLYMRDGADSCAAGKYSSGSSCVACAAGKYSAEVPWIEVANLKPESTQNCPSGFSYISSPRACRRGCDTCCSSHTFSIPGGKKYTEVKGKIVGYQFYSMDAFHMYNARDINSYYVDGISITHGSPRKHLWTYAVGISQDSNYPDYNCPCYNGNGPPGFVGSHYYCESGNSGGWESQWYADDPLWDGSGCPQGNGCCSPGNADLGLPWFFREVDETNDAIELRLCSDQGRSNEDVAFREVELYVRSATGGGDVCQPCAAGRYGETSAMASADCTGLCPKGHYCPEGTAEPVKCPKGKYSSSTGNDEEGDCKSCDAGYYCEAGSDDSEGTGPCPAGRYSTGGASDATCEGGCQSGYFCRQGSTTATASACGIGNYCPSAASEPTPIAKGYYGIGGSDASTRTGQRQCTAGTYCAAGEQKQCPAGTYGATAGLYKKHRTCADVAADGVTSDGVYTIFPPEGDGGVDVYCVFSNAAPFAGAGWTLVASEQQGHAQQLVYLSQASGTAEAVAALGNGNIGPLFKDAYDMVIITWGSNWAKFKVDFDLFENKARTTAAVTEFATSDDTLKAWVESAGGAEWCQASVATSVKPGDTSWGFTPQDDDNRDCGCNSGGWAGRGVYYGGHATGCTQCGCHGGSISGVKSNGGAKGGQTAFDVKVYVGWSDAEDAGNPCTGACRAGYHCPAGSVTDTAGFCELEGQPPGSTYCPEGSTSIKVVDDGHYTTPLDAALNRRTGQAECPGDYVCTDGIRKSALEWSAGADCDEGTAAGTVPENEAAADVSPVFGANNNGVGGIAYEIASQDPDASCANPPSDPFEIDADTGAVSLKAGVEVDYEDCHLFSVVVRATGSQSTLECTVALAVNDGNDPPTFDAALYERDVDELSAEGTAVGEPVAAADPDAGQELSYDIIAGNDDGYFRIGTCSGQISMLREDLRFTDHELVTLTVKVTDDGDPAMSATTTVEVSINNVNDPPYWTSDDFGFHVPENSAAGVAVTPAPEAADPDGDTLTYRLSSNADGAFEIDSATGALVVARRRGILRNPLAETDASGWTAHGSAEVAWAAGDEGELVVTSGAASGTPGVRQDNVAVQGCTHYTVEVEGHSSAPAYVWASLGPAVLPFVWVGNTVQLPASADGGLTRLTFKVPCGISVISFGVLFSGESLADDSAMHIESVVLDTQTRMAAGAVTLNYEAKNVYTVELTVTDDANTPLSARLLAEVLITNENDAPTVLEAPVSVSELAANGALVGLPVNAQDEDPGTVLSFAITGGNDDGVFALSGTSPGQLVVADASTLDYETTQAYTLEMVVTDNGLNGQGATKAATFHQVINVADANERPSFPDQSVSVTEDAPPGLQLPDAILVASDPDIGQNHTFRATGGEGASMFRVESDGHVTVVGALDYETQSTWTLTVSTTDNGSPAKTSAAAGTLTVNVLDVNEAPHWPDGEAYRAIAENNAPGAEVGDVLACSDPDPDDAGLLTYAVGDNVPVAADGSSPLFTVDAASGQLTVADSLDYEVAPRYTFDITASDPGGRHATTRMVIDVLNQNEAPSVPAATRSVPERTAPVEGGLAFGDKIAGADEDEGDALKLVWELVSGTEAPAACVGMFDVTAGDPKCDGEDLSASVVGGQLLLLEEALQHGSADCTFTLRVTDCGGDVGTGTVTVVFSDANSYPVLNDVTVSVPEMTNGTAVLVESLGATDSDNDNLAFSVVYAEGADYEGTFAVDLNVGWMFTVSNGPNDEGQLALSGLAPLDYETTATFTIDIEVEDDGPGRLQTFATVTLNVLDEPEPPLITVPSLQVREDAAPGTVVGTLTATDEDVGETLRFFLDGVNVETGAITSSPFDASPTSGIVTTVLPLDYETKSVYTVEAWVRDKDGLVDRRRVELFVIDVNEPVTAEDSSFSVPEDSPVGTAVGAVVAHDPDATDDYVDTVTYAIIDGNVGNAFAVDGMTGVITVAKALDFETVESYALSVIVRDTGRDGSSFNATAAVHVDVGDVNDVTIDDVAGDVVHATGGGSVVKWSGTNFGKVTRSVTAVYGPAFDPGRYTAQSCEITQHNVEIECVASAGLGLALRWTFVIGGADVFGPTQQTTRYAAPVVTAVSANKPPSSGGSTGDALVTLTGANFGPAGTAVDEAVYGRQERYDATPLCVVVSPSTIACGTVPGVGQALQWRVTIAAQPSEWSGPTAATSYKAPYLEAVSVPAPVEEGGDVPDGAATATDALSTRGGETLLLTGTGFGPGFSALASTAQNTAARVTATYAMAIADGDAGDAADYQAVTYEAACAVTVPHTELACTTAAGVGAGHVWTVVVGGQGSVAPTPADDVSTSYEAPAITAVTGEGAVDGSTRGGERVNIVGSAFGPGAIEDAVGLVTYGRAAGGALAGDAFVAASCRVSTPHSVLSCDTAPGTGGGHSWRVVIGGQASAVTLPLVEVAGSDAVLGTSYAAPIVSYFEGAGAVDAVTDGGEDVLVHGLNFGFDAGKVTSVHYSRAGSGVVFAATQWWIEEPHITLGVKTEPGAGKDLEWVVVVDDLVSSAAVTNYGPPQIHEARVSAGGGGGGGGGAHSLSTDGGDTVWLVGDNFGPPAFTDANGTQHAFLRSVTYGATGREYAATDVHHANHTHISCVTVPGFGSSLRFRVVVEHQESEASPYDTASVSYSAPVITSVAPASSDTNAKPRVRITGRNLALLDPSAVVRVYFGNAEDGSMTKTPLTTLDPHPLWTAVPDDYVLGESAHSVSANLPEGIGLHRAVRVVLSHAGGGKGSSNNNNNGGGGGGSGTVTSAPFPFDFNGPRLNYVLVDKNATSGEVVLTAFGESFGATMDDDVTRQVLIRARNSNGEVDMTVEGGNFSTANVARIVSWDHTAVVVVPRAVHGAPLDIGDLKLAIGSTAYALPGDDDGLDANAGGGAAQAAAIGRGLEGLAHSDWQQSRSYYFAKASPALSNREGAAQLLNNYRTEGYVDADPPAEGTAEYRRRVLSLVLLNLDGVTSLAVNVSDSECALLDDPLSLTPTYYDNPDEEINDRTEWTVRCKLPAGEGTDVPVTVVKNGQKNAAMSISYAAPTITDVSSTSAWVLGGSTPVTAPTTGFAMTVTGNDFGVWPRLLIGTTVVRKVGDPAVAAGDVGNHHWFDTASHTQLTLTVPDGAGAGLTLGLLPPSPAQTVQSLPFAYEPPTVASLTYAASPTTGGADIVVTGTNFGPASLTPRVDVAGVVCSGVSMEVPHTRLRCASPPGSGAALHVTVDVARQVVLVPAAYSYQPPALAGWPTATSQALSLTDEDGQSVSAAAGQPLRGDTAGDYNVTIAGADFGPPGSPLCVFSRSVSRTDGAPACDGRETFFGEGELPSWRVLSHTHDAITVALPPGMGRHRLSVTAGGQHSDAAAANAAALGLEPNFEFLAPELWDISPASGGTDGGGVLTLSGRNLGQSDGPTPQAVRISFHTGCLSNSTWPEGATPPAVSECAYDVISHSDGAIVFVAPPGIGRDREVSVTVVDGTVEFTASQPVLFHYDPPEITTVYPNPHLADADPQTVRIVGNNFGRLGDLQTAEERAIAVLVHGTTCTDARRISDQNVLECALEPLSVGHKNVTITIAAQTGSLAHTSNNALMVACQRGFYGQPGEPCLECPRGGVCHGFDDFQHTEPFSEPGWFKLNGTIDRCHAERVPTFGETREFCVHIAPCEPPWACVGDNKCEVGYRSVAPIHRCALCDNCYRGPSGDGECKAYYRRAGECVECPDNPLLLILGFLVGGICAGTMGYVLNRKSVNLAFVSIGIDYFQVLAMFANSRVQWPAAIKELFIIMSLFNLNIEITAPECSIPDISYETKWWFIMGVPLVAGLLFLLQHSALYCKKRFILRQSKRLLHSHVSTLIATGLVMFYFLYLQLTRTTLDVFNCSPTDPPDGYEYLQVVFEPCWQAGGLQMRLIGPAIITLIAYVLGYPLVVFALLRKNKLKVMEDQLLRARGTGNDKISNPNCHEFRRRYHKVYYHFKPDKYYWILVIIARKFGIAFTSLMFNKNPAFQLSIALLIMFTCYAAQVRHVPYMSPSERNQVLLDHEKAVAEGDPVHERLAQTISAVSKTGKKKTRNLGWKASKDKTQQAKAAAAAAAAFLFSYNSVEAILLACAVLVNLAGVMFESNRFDSDYYESQRDAIAYITILVIVTSIVYFLTVFFSEIYTTVCADRVAAKRLQAEKAGKGKRITTAKPGGLGFGAGVEMSIASSDTTSQGANPLFTAGASGRNVGAALSPGAGATVGAGPAAEDVNLLLEENANLRAQVQQLKKAAELRAHAGPAARLARGRGAASGARKKHEFAPQASSAAGSAATAGSSASDDPPAAGDAGKPSSRAGASVGTAKAAAGKGSAAGAAGAVGAAAAAGAAAGEKGKKKKVKGKRPSAPPAKRKGPGSAPPPPPLDA